MVAVWGMGKGVGVGTRHRMGGGSRETGNASEGPYEGSCWYSLPLSAFHLFKGAAKATALTSVL